MAANDVPGSLPTLTVDHQHPVSCTEYKPTKRWNKVTITNTSDIEMHISVWSC